MTRASEFMTFHFVEGPAFRALAPRVLWPARPRLAECLEALCGWSAGRARAVAKGTERSDWGDGRMRPAPPEPPRLRVLYPAPAIDPADAWAQVAPAMFREPSGRLFFGDTVDPREPAPDSVLRTTWGAKKLCPAPPTLAAVLAVAGDPEGILEAESLAFEACRRLARSGVAMPPRVVWHIEPSPMRMRYPGEVPRQLLDAELGLTLDELDRGQVPMLSARVPQGAWRFEWQRAAWHDHQRSEAWERGATTCSARENPFQPLVQLWMRGYGIEAITHEVIVLAANSVPIGSTMMA